MLQTVSRNILVVSPYDDIFKNTYVDGFYSQAMLGISRAAQETGCRTTIINERKFVLEASPRVAPYFLKSYAGVLIFCPHQNWDLYIDLARAAGLPVALVNRTTAKPDVIVVREKDRAGMIRKMLEHLMELGRRRIISVNQPDFFPLSLYHIDCFRTACRALELDDTQVIQHKDPDKLIDELHRTHAMPQAFFAANDLMAIGLIRKLQQTGYRVPRDVAVVGCDNVPHGAQISPALTTIDIRIDTMTFTAVKLLSERIEGQLAGGRVVEIEGELVIRESCGAKETTNSEGRTTN
jgi:DNA-binding LacI/PurR family transcriptional regulator